MLNTRVEKNLTLGVRENLTLGGRERVFGQNSPEKTKKKKILDSSSSF